MSWFDTAGLASFAKSALKEAQKQIDKALDIQEEETDSSGKATTKQVQRPATSKTEPSTPSFSGQAGASNVWGSFTGSFFESPPTATSTVTTPPSAASARDSESVELVTSPESQSSPLQSTATVLNSESIEVLGAVGEARSENSSFMVVASSASTPASEFSERESVSQDVLNEAASSRKATADGEENEGDEDAFDEFEEEDEENTVSESLAVTVMEPSAGRGEAIVTVPPSRQSLSLPLSSTTAIDIPSKANSTSTTDLACSTGSDQTLINQSGSTGSLAGPTKSTTALSLENYEMHTEFSDSTQSFEEVPRSGSSDTTGANGRVPATSSGDEMETTTTSSDIEIISNPNGGDSSSTHSRLSPNKDGVVIIGGHGGPGGAFKGHRGHSRELSAASSQCSDELSETDRLHRRISELSEQLEKREFKLMEVLKQNSDLHSRNEEMRFSRSSLPGGNLSSSATNNSPSGPSSSANSAAAAAQDTEEFTQRLSALEKKFQNAIRERDQLRDQLTTIKSETTKRIPREEHDAEVKEKEFLIGELKLEGEKLSKQILQHSTIIKKLRAKEKETDEAVKRQREELRQQQDEVDRLKRSLAAKEDVEKNQIEAVNRLASTKIILETENGELKGRLDDVQQKLDALQVSFNATKQELVDQKRLTVELRSKSANLESQCAEKQEEKIKGDQMEKEVQELREKLRQLETASNGREQTMRRETTDLMRRLEESEMRNEELNQQVALATVPLLKQMEGLQATLNSRTTIWERQERDLVDTLSNAEARLKLLVDIESKSKATEEGLRSEIDGLEQRIAGLVLKVEQTSANAQQREIEMQLRLADVEREVVRGNEAKRAVEEQVRELEERVAQKTEAIDQLEGELRTRKSLEGNQHHQRFEREEFGTDLEVHPQHHEGGGHPRTGSPPLTRENSLDGSLTSNQWPMDDIDNMSNHGRPSLGSFYGGGGGFGGLVGGHTSTLENLQSNLKQRDGEVYHLQWEMNRLQSQRNTLADEISKLTNQVEALSSKCAQHDEIVSQYGELQKKYDAMLQLYGEKVEEAEELRLDLLDSKEAYKAQIDDLLAQPQFKEKREQMQKQEDLL